MTTPDAGRATSTVNFDVRVKRQLRERITFDGRFKNVRARSRWPSSNFESASNFDAA